MLTFMVRHKDSSLFIIDEPDIYLHSDLQRQLVSALRDLGPDILLATHSTEIIAEAEPNEILVVTKRAQSAKRVSDLTQLRSIFSTLGSNLNPTLTQLARSKRVVYVEGRDFQIMARFAAKLGIRGVATRSEFAVVPTEGFNPAKARMFTEGVEATLGAKILTAVVFDRDYRSDEEVRSELAELNRFCDYAHIHSKKELENFLLVPDAIASAIAGRIADQNERRGGGLAFGEDVEDILLAVTEPMKHDVQAQFLKRRAPFAKSLNKALDDATITSGLLASFDEKWKDLKARLDVVPGKAVLSGLNRYLQEKYAVSITPALIIDAMEGSDVANEMVSIIKALELFAKSAIKE
jgi:hypothetical protein